MRTQLVARSLLVLAVPALLAGCPRQKKETLTYTEAKLALEEAKFATEAQGLTSAAVEITTNFTIGQAVETAAAELRAFIVSQLPCAEITLSGATLSIEYGKNAGSCSYRGHQFSGVHTVTVSRSDEGEVLVEHDWNELSNGVVQVTGEATVTWNFQDKSRHVVHSATWTNVATGRSASGEGDRLQTVLEGGLLEGIQVDGSRSWTTSRGTWDLAIDGVQMRWSDPVPQAGSYTLGTPFDKSVSMSFARQDGDTIRVTVASGDKSFSFDVTSLGRIESAS